VDGLTEPARSSGSSLNASAVSFGRLMLAEAALAVELRETLTSQREGLATGFPSN
jgi:hypothetical protein